MAKENKEKVVLCQYVSFTHNDTFGINETIIWALGWPCDVQTQNTNTLTHTQTTDLQSVTYTQTHTHTNKI